jgi:gliding motility-associated-like protein
LFSFSGFAQNAPNAVNDFSTGNEDSPQSINIISNDSDPDGPVLGTWVSITAGPNNGQQLYDASTGLLSYVPSPNFFGNDTVWYTLCDGGTPNLCDDAYAVFVVNPVNDKPFLVGDTASTLEEVSITFNTMDNDSDIDGIIDYSTFNVLAGPYHGTYTVDPVTGDITYTPNMDYNGVDSLIYTVCDNGLPVLCDTAVAYIVVNFVNDAPVATDDYATCLEDGSVDIPILANDFDIDGWLVVQSYHLIVQSPNAQIIWNASTQMFTYIPNPGFFGQDTMVYMICDNGTPILCDTALIIITVEHVNHPPSAGSGIMINVNDYGSDSVNLLDQASDVDPMDSLIVTVIQDPAHGTYTLVDGVLTYFAEHGHCGYDEIIYTICDNGDPVLCDTNTITIYTEPLDSDGDGLSDFWEYRDDNQDFDGDGTPDYMDLDSDNDNLTDEYESSCDNDLCEERLCDCPVDPNGIAEWVDRTACIDFEVPNGFSPNGDGNFDTWTFDVGDQFPNSTLHIYNRWGNKLLEFQGPVFEWDGRATGGTSVIGGSDDVLPVGTYFYVLDLGYEGTDPIQGFVYLNK